jgi:ATP-dependent Lhr-like helicase
MEDHPLIRETKRECMEDYWDLPGLLHVLKGIQTGRIRIREIHRKEPSPMSLPLRRAAESMLLYDYFPSTRNIGAAVVEALTEMQKIKPAAEQLARASERKKQPEDERQLHSLLMMEGDLVAGELDLPVEWFETLARQGRAAYIEPGLWIAEEQRDVYAAAFGISKDHDKSDTERALFFDDRDVSGGRPPKPFDDIEKSDADRAQLLVDMAESDPAWESARKGILRRLLRYRGAHEPEMAADRYCIPVSEAEYILNALLSGGEAVYENGLYYHADLYEYARNETIRARRRQAKTQPPQAYAALLANRLRISAPSGEQLNAALSSLMNRAFPPAQWEGALLPARVNHYRPALLDTLLTGGEWFWRLTNENGAFALSFSTADEIDWDFDLSAFAEALNGGEKQIYEILLKRGASFVTALPAMLDGETAGGEASRDETLDGAESADPNRRSGTTAPGTASPPGKIPVHDGKGFGAGGQLHPGAAVA